MDKLSGQLCQCLTVFMGKNLFLISIPNLSLSIAQSSPLILSPLANSHPFSKLLLKKLNQTGPRTNHSSTPFVSGTSEICLRNGFFHSFCATCHGLWGHPRDVHHMGLAHPNKATKILFLVVVNICNSCPSS